MVNGGSRNAAISWPLRTSRRSPTSTGWFQVFAAPAQFTFGNSPRSGLRGARLAATDVTLEKSIWLKEKSRFDVRGEFYNILNHANFNVPGATFGAADFGFVTSARPGRTVQLARRLSF